MLFCDDAIYHSTKINDFLNLFKDIHAEPDIEYEYVMDLDEKLEVVNKFKRSYVQYYIELRDEFQEKAENLEKVIKKRKDGKGFAYEDYGKFLGIVLTKSIININSLREKSTNGLVKKHKDLKNLKNKLKTLKLSDKKEKVRNGREDSDVVNYIENSRLFNSEEEELYPVYAQLYYYFLDGEDKPKGRGTQHAGVLVHGIGNEMI